MGYINAFVVFILAVLGLLLQGLKENEKGEKIVNRWGTYVPTRAGAIMLTLLVFALAISLRAERRQYQDAEDLASELKRARQEIGAARQPIDDSVTMDIVFVLDDGNTTGAAKSYFDRVRGDPGSRRGSRGRGLRFRVLPPSLLPRCSDPVEREVCENVQALIVFFSFTKGHPEDSQLFLKAGGSFLPTAVGQERAARPSSFDEDAAKPETYLGMAYPSRSFRLVATWRPPTFLKNTGEITGFSDLIGARVTVTLDGLTHFEDLGLSVHSVTLRRANGFRIRATGFQPIIGAQGRQRARSFVGSIPRLAPSGSWGSGSSHRTARNVGEIGTV